MIMIQYIYNMFDTMIVLAFDPWVSQFMFSYVICTGIYIMEVMILMIGYETPVICGIDDAFQTNDHKLCFTGNVSKEDVTLCYKHVI